MCISVGVCALHVCMYPFGGVTGERKHEHRPRRPPAKFRHPWAGCWLSQELRPLGLLGASPWGILTPHGGLSCHAYLGDRGAEAGSLPKASRLGHISQTSFQAVLPLATIFKRNWEKENPTPYRRALSQAGETAHTWPSSQGLRAVFRRVAQFRGRDARSLRSRGMTGFACVSSDKTQLAHYVLAQPGSQAWVLQGVFHQKKEQLGFSCYSWLLRALNVYREQKLKQYCLCPSSYLIETRHVRA